MFQGQNTPRASILTLQRLCNPLRVPEFEAKATTGQGVFETLKAVAKLVLADLKKMGG